MCMQPVRTFTLAALGGGGKKILGSKQTNRRGNKGMTLYQ